MGAIGKVTPAAAGWPSGVHDAGNTLKPFSPSSWLAGPNEGGSHGEEKKR